MRPIRTALSGLRRDETGAVTIEMVALMVGVVMLAMAVGEPVHEALLALVNDVAGMIRAVDVGGWSGG